MQNLDSARKSMIYCRKNGSISIFPIFASKFRWTKYLRSKISRRFEKNSEKWICQDLLDIERNKVMKNEPISCIRQKSTREKPQGGGGTLCPPPCKIGLKINFKSLKKLENVLNTYFIAYISYLAVHHEIRYLYHPPPIKYFVALKNLYRCQMLYG